MSPSPLQRAVRGFAVYDLLVTLPFATPWTAAAMLGAMRWAHEGLSLRGEAMPAFTPTHLFFVALFGVLAVIWALVRILQPTALHGAIDTVGRGLVASWMVLAITQGASQVLGTFMVMELAGMFVQGALLLGARRRDAAPVAGA
ncbi:hypothetical protein [Corallococcus carmarthensis]|uniref:Uncharacterized protein n=1 Tax=Corallococcus carmarthensis TaxID=2316728 RepID=A0A3A8JRY7_9BACT|nr:hypothetical protein [Corallococcus carmarthensis]NOK22224.1 hypothetical protein [Corallococcus carmarthensis]RKG95104.1 hypothetical protein D7X32_40050 [Corallococcus carmarthensis]